VRSRSIASSLLAASAAALLAGCGGSPQLSPQLRRQVDALRTGKPPAYWLGERHGALRLVHVETGGIFTSSLYYADCSWVDLNALGPRCHRVVEVDNDRSVRGEITTQGRCTFRSTVNGATVASFPVNPDVLRVFLRGATIYVGAQRLSDRLDAAAALRPLNRPRSKQLPHRDVDALLGTCRAPKPKPPVHLTAKQQYEQAMKGSFLIDSLGFGLNGVDPAAAKPKVLLDEFLSDTESFPPLLRNEAARIDAIRPPAGLQKLQDALAAGLRDEAATVDDARVAAKRDGLDAQAWEADREKLEPELRDEENRLLRTVRAFRARGYSIYVKPSD
jgi:hypothetical protein